MKSKGRDAPHIGVPLVWHCGECLLKCLESGQVEKNEKDAL